LVGRARRGVQARPRACYCERARKKIMRMLKRLLFGVLTLAVLFAIVVWMQPDDYRLTRQIAIAAPASAIFPHVNDLRQWEDWSPWAKLDPNAKISFEGPLAGPGAMFHWSGNDKIGAGTMTITESKPDQRIATRTDFTRPFEGSGNADFIFSQSGDQTNVIWTMSGTQSFIGKAICLVMSMERTVGPDFEKGLAQLKAVSEKR
jgi:uncharacterized protein YndB with AHSA1/START domain